MSMGNISVYLPDELEARVKAAEGLNISRICQTALAREVEQAEATKAAKRKGPFKRIEAIVGGEGRPSITKAFFGRWLVSDMEHNLTKWSVALTKGGSFAFYANENEGRQMWLGVYESPEDALLDDDGDENVPEDVVAAVNAALGVNTVIELDI